MQKKRIQRVITFLLAVCIAFVMIYFTGFEAEHFTHKCNKDDCPICHELQIAETMLKQFSAIAAVMIVVSFFMAFGKCTEAVNSRPFQGRTLILDMVRMDD